jgi:hypothetical protein
LESHISIPRDRTVGVRVDKGFGAEILRDRVTIDSWLTVPRRQELGIHGYISFKENCACIRSEIEALEVNGRVTGIVC